VIGHHQLALRDVSLSDIACLVGGRLSGSDRPIRHIRPLSASHIPEDTLTFAAGRYVAELDGKPFAAAIVTNPVDIENLTAIIHPNPTQALFAAHRALIETGAYPVIETHRGSNVKVARSAVVHEGTILSDGVNIGDCAVIMPNTALGEDVTVQAGTVVGEPGLQVAESDLGRYLVPHAGGVRIDRGVSVGANCAIDRGLFSTFTTIGPETMLDNMVHVAHDVSIGARCTLTAAVEISGSAVLEDDVWLAPRTCCNQFIRFGRGAYTGTGSVVVRDVEPFTLVVGSPAKPAGRVCLCRSKLAATEGPITCQVCGKTYVVARGSVIPAGRSAA
jgi:UDP-3-O-[3-hydroxymyristoyl] glucosamine N-acyltransferase